MTAPTSKHTPAAPASTEPAPRVVDPFSIADGWRQLVAAMTPNDGTVSISIPTRDRKLVQIAPRFGPDRLRAGRAEVGAWAGWRVYLFDLPAAGRRTVMTFRGTSPDRRYRSALLTTVEQVAAEVERLLAVHPPR